MNISNGTRSCFCTDYFTVNKCEQRLCTNGGSAVGANCSCPAGYSGTHCTDGMCLWDALVYCIRNGLDTVALCTVLLIASLRAYWQITGRTICIRVWNYERCFVFLIKSGSKNRFDRFQIVLDILDLWISILPKAVTKNSVSFKKKKRLASSDFQHTAHSNSP